MNAEHLYSENVRLKRQLKAYLTQAKENEQKFLRLHTILIRLLMANDLPTLIDIILTQYRTESKLDAITLSWLDPEYEFRRTLTNEGFNFKKYPGLIFPDRRPKLRTHLSDDLSPQLDKCTTEDAEVFFPCYDQKPASMAILPLVRGRKLVGSLNLGSNDEQRFINGSATDFFQQFSSILAICIENALNQERIKLLGLLDPLTGVHNRRYFDQRLQEEATRANRQSKPLSCLFLDIDHFKKFNDKYGHHIGDRVLQEVATVIKGQMRMSDVMARYGGEEFAILLTQTDTGKAEEIAERVRLAIAKQEHQLTEELSTRITVSVGCSTIIGDRENANDSLGEDLLSQADSALYEAKDLGRNQVCCYQPPQRKQKKASVG